MRPEEERCLYRLLALFLCAKRKISAQTVRTRRPELVEVYAATSPGHPPEPHWFLPLISVDPFVRGSGLGSALMKYGLAACDRDGVPACLDSTHPRNIPFYERFGFERVGTIEIGGHPPVYPMLRRPNRSRDLRTPERKVPAFRDGGSTGHAKGLGLGRRGQIGLGAAKA